MEQFIPIIIAGLSGGAAAALITSIFAEIGRKRTLDAEMRKTAVEAGLEVWRHMNSIKSDLIKAGGKGDVHFDAPYGYISVMLRVTHIAADTSISCKDAAERIQKEING